MYFSTAASSENEHGSMNLASNTASDSLHNTVEGCLVVACVRETMAD